MIANPAHLPPPPPVTRGCRPARRKQPRPPLPPPPPYLPRRGTVPQGEKFIGRVISLPKTRQLFRGGSPLVYGIYCWALGASLASWGARVDSRHGSDAEQQKYHQFGRQGGGGGVLFCLFVLFWVRGCRRDWGKHLAEGVPWVPAGRPWVGGVRAPSLGPAVPGAASAAADPHGG